jgi:hypothetical protein
VYDEKMRKLRAGVHVLDHQYKIILIQNDIEQQGKLALLYWLGLFLGIICILLSLCWVAQIITQFIIIPDGKPIHPLINELFIFFTENNISFLAFFFFSMFCIYLLLATVKGNVKFGLRIFCCWTLHPMK